MTQLSHGDLVCTYVEANQTSSGRSATAWQNQGTGPMRAPSCSTQFVDPNCVSRELQLGRENFDRSIESAQFSPHVLQLRCPRNLRRGKTSWSAGFPSQPRPGDLQIHISDAIGG